MGKRAAMMAAIPATVALWLIGSAVVRNWAYLSEINVSGEERVARARIDSEPRLRELCAKAGVPFPPARIYLRAFKSERELEVWVAESASTPMRILQTYAIAGMSGTLGPKRREGDRQVPEGFYRIDRFNPNSSFHLSLGLDYPNVSDRLLGDAKKPGSDIFIHGDTRSIGCLAMTDEKIDEIYTLALEAKRLGQSSIPVHIFPARMDEAGWKRLQERYVDRPALIRFWQGLQPVYAAFEESRRTPEVTILRDGGYQLRKAAR